MAFDQREACTFEHKRHLLISISQGMPSQMFKGQSLISGASIFTNESSTVKAHLDINTHNTCLITYSVYLNATQNITHHRESWIKTNCHN